MLKTMKWLCGVALLVPLLMIHRPVMAATDTVVWSTASPMAAARSEHTATLLPDGKVLVAGGTDGTTTFSSAELYDPITNNWSSAGSMAISRRAFTATLLSNGKVLVTGGGSPELYDPATNSWSSAGYMILERYSHSAVLLPNGKVLVVGGGALSIAELYDPLTNSWSFAGSMTINSILQSAVLLPSGKVLVAGGFSSSSIPLIPLTRAELYDPYNNSWSSAGSMEFARYEHSATLLSNGKVLVAGGFDGYTQRSTAELYDPITNSWGPAASMAGSRGGHTATLLADGNVLVTGGRSLLAINGSWSLSSAETFNPVTNIWSTTDSMAVARHGHSATLLSNGKVLVAGGEKDSIKHSSAELYTEASWPKIEITPSSYDFGAVKLKHSSSQKDFVIKNSGDAPLTIKGIDWNDSESEDFILWNSNACVKTIEANGSCTFQISFSPSTEGVKFESIQIISNDHDTPELKIPVTGIGGNLSVNLDVTPINQSDDEYVWHDDIYTFAAGCVPTSLAMIIDNNVRQLGYNNIDFNLVMKQLRGQYLAFNEISKIDSIVNWFYPISNHIPIETKIYIDNVYLDMVSRINLGNGYNSEITWKGYSYLHDPNNFIDKVKGSLHSKQPVAVNTWVVDKKYIKKEGNELKFTQDPSSLKDKGHEMVIRGLEINPNCSDKPFNICQFVLNDTNSDQPRYFDYYKISWGNLTGTAFSQKGDPSNNVYVVTGNHLDLISISDINITPNP